MKLFPLIAFTFCTVVAFGSAKATNADQQYFQKELDQLDEYNRIMGAKLAKGQITKEQYDSWYRQADQLHSQLVLYLKEAGTPSPGATSIVLNWMKANRERNTAGGVYVPQTKVYGPGPSSTAISIKPYRTNPSTGRAEYTDGHGNYYAPNGGSGFRDQKGNNYLWNGQGYVRQ
jgi:hypothetical protein